jgi:hypothetical protein
MTEKEFSQALRRGLGGAIIELRYLPPFLNRRIFRVQAIRNGHRGTPKKESRQIVTCNECEQGEVFGVFHLYLSF